MAESKQGRRDGKAAEASRYDGWEIFQPLVSDEADQAGFRIHDAPGADGPEAHRVWITGYDRDDDVTAVRGRLYHVVHGVVGGGGGCGGKGSRRPATLVVFEWLLVPGRLGRRFREVDIDVVFSASGGRVGKPEGSDLSAFTPEVAAVAPSVPIKSFVTGRDVAREAGRKAGVTVGHAPYGSAGAEASGRTTQTTTRTDYRFVAGYPKLSGRSYPPANAAHWKLQENAPQESGAPHLVRTAVLLKRRASPPDYGTFSARVTTAVNVSFWSNAAETIRGAVGLVPRDDPVTFDPKRLIGGGGPHGPAVLYGEKDESAGASKTSPCDEMELAAEDLTKFLVKDDDAEWMVSKAPAAAAAPAGAQGDAEGKQLGELTLKLELEDGGEAGDE